MVLAEEWFNAESTLKTLILHWNILWPVYLTQDNRGWENDTLSDSCKDKHQTVTRGFYQVDMVIDFVSACVDYLKLLKEELNINVQFFFWLILSKKVK